MTLPNERTRALLQVREFLARLSSPYLENGIKKIPMAVRAEARALLRHYPMMGDLFCAAEKAPGIFDIDTLNKVYDDIYANEEKQ